MREISVAGLVACAVVVMVPPASAEGPSCESGFTAGYLGLFEFELMDVAGVRDTPDGANEAYVRTPFYIKSLEDLFSDEGSPERPDEEVDYPYGVVWLRACPVADPQPFSQPAALECSERFLAAMSEMGSPGAAMVEAWTKCVVG